MRMLLAGASTILSVCLVATVARADTELKNDGFVNNQAAGFQSGFVVGEIGASRFIAPAAGRRLLAVQLLFGGAAGTRTVTLNVWDDSAGTNAPGTLLYDGEFELTSSNDSLNALDLSSENVVVPAQFRVGIQFQHAGLPSIARDTDGTINADKNYIRADATGTPTWFRSQALGLQGDWIIRAVVSDGMSGTPDAAVSIDASMGGPDAGTGGPDGGGSGNVCTGNGDCELGEYCNTSVGACTFDCREDSDCPGSNACNSLGQCVAGDGGGGGCETGGGGAGGALGAVGLAGLFGLLVTRRRRGSRAA